MDKARPLTITERIDNITAIPPGALREDPPVPRAVKIELTARCNFNCSFCARSQRLRNQGDMDPRLFTRLADEMRAAGVEELGLFYLGESFMLDWLAAGVWYAKRICGYPYVFLTTNGSVATPTKMEACMLNGLDSLKFSFNYADAEQFARVARVKPRLYDDLRRNVEAAREIRDRVERRTGHRCALGASYILYDGDQGERMAQVVAEIEPYLDEVYALPLYTQAALIGETLDREGWCALAGNPGRADALREPVPCWAVFTEGHVTFDGKLSACCFDHEGRFHMGDLTTTPFVAAWLSDEFRALRGAHLRRDLRNTPCGVCAAYGECSP